MLLTGEVWSKIRILGEQGENHMKVVQIGTSLVFGVLSAFLVHAGCMSDQSLSGSTQEVSDSDPGLHCTAGSDLDAERACSLDQAKKTTICHVPPGNPMNAHTLSVGTPSVEAHLAHGDYLGTCKLVLECTTEPPPPPAPPPPVPPAEPVPTEPVSSEPPPVQL